MRYNGVGFIVSDPSETQLEHNVHIVKRNKKGGIDQVDKGGKPLGSMSYAISKNVWYRLTLVVDHDQARYVGYINNQLVLDVIDSEPGDQWPSYTNQYHTGVLTWMENKGMDHDPNNERWGDLFQQGQNHQAVFDNYIIYEGLRWPNDDNTAPEITTPASGSIHSPTTIALNVAATDDDGDALEYIWKSTVVPDGQPSLTASGPTPVVTLGSAGTYEFTATVSDGWAQATSTTDPITVEQVSQGVVIQP